ncbi:pyridoxamine 5'-phosphate oxidase family protein [Streptacidiphilus sp. EB103A]|uniref:pyridoxamine 5'-phosphate oxidase family protein n=1 Tax=Streptacidiphilus sp. EB103A TaxID=3156275 RepID=UPI003519992C
MDPIDLPRTPHTTLSADECLRLLARGSLGSLGRIVYTRHALPVVLPVRFDLDFSGALTVTTPDGSGLAADLDGTVVAFQVDSAHQDAAHQDAAPQDAADRGPYDAASVSVMVHGTARATKDGTGLRLVPELISGLRLETGSAEK